MNRSYTKLALLLAVAGATAIACGPPEPPKKSDAPVVIINNGGNNTSGTNGVNNDNNGPNNGTNGGTNGETNGPPINNVVTNNETAAPRILTFDANVSRITEGATVTFTAVVTDPDGIDDLIGGTLNDPTSGRPYGSFSTAAAEGSYSIVLSWDEIHNVEAINFASAKERLFRADFFDVAGNTIQQTLPLELHCDGREACDGGCGLSVCEGTCVDDRFESVDHCGQCGNDCPIGADCDGTSCSCASFEDVCANECVNLANNDDHCGECGNACSCEAGLCFCGEDADCDFGERCVRHEYSVSTVRSSCITYDQFRIQGGGKEGFLELNINGMWIPACNAFRATSYDAAQLACDELFGTTGSYTEMDAGAIAPYYPGVFCPDGATSLDECDIELEYSCSFSDFVYVTCD